MLTIILKILYHRFLVGLWVWWSTLGNTVKKWPFEKILPQLCKTSCIVILIILHKWEKRVKERNKRLSLWILFINWGTQPIYDFCWLNHWTWLISDPLPGSWFSNFFKNGEGWDCFWLAKVLSRLRKIIYLPKTVKTNKQGESWFAQKQKNDFQFWTAPRQQNEQFENPYISSLGEARSIKFRVSVIQRVQLSTPLQKELTLLPHIHMTLKNLFISSLKGYCYQIWAVKQLLDRSPQGTSPMRVVTSLPFDNVTLINLYISSYRKATLTMIIQANA